MVKLLWTAAFILLLVSCTYDDPTNTLRSAYYWSTTWSIDSSKMNFIREHHIKRLYIRYFDVVKDDAGNIVPNATIQFPNPVCVSVSEDEHHVHQAVHTSVKENSPVPDGIEAVPVVYIVNDCLRPTTQSSVGQAMPAAQLADRIFDRILQIGKANDIAKPKEIQIDCDWTATTQQAYFDFLELLKKKAHAKNIRLSATIRLHQLPMTPPPVDKGVLMMYNTGDAKQLKCQKPILDTKDAAPYILHLAAYPLKLSAAYPLFRWRILFREGKFVGIMHTDDDFPVLPSDSIVVRQPEMEDIMEAVKSVNAQNKEINNEVILFDLNNQNIKRFSNEDYEQIFRH